MRFSSAAIGQQEIEAPVFIIGNFRSGSTLLQRLLAKDEEHLTAMTTLEIYIAPSITQRVFWKAAGKVDTGALPRGVQQARHPRGSQEPQQHPHAPRRLAGCG